MSKKGKGDRLVLLVLGRDGILLLAYPSMVDPPSEINMRAWKNLASLRVRYSSTGRVRGVAVFGHAVSDVLPTPRRDDPSPRRPESPTPLGQPSDLVLFAGRRRA